MTNDGVTIAREIHLKNQFQNMGAQLVKEAAIKTNDIVGDGTTTATVIAQAIVREGNKAIGAGANPVLVKRGIDLAVARLVARLAEVAYPVATESDYCRVAAIPASLEAIVTDPYILLCSEKITKVQQLMPLLDKIMRDPRPLVIIAEAVEGTALSMLVHNHVKPPGRRWPRASWPAAVPRCSTRSRYSHRGRSGSARRSAEAAL